jgi:hypothetical protein
MNACPLDLALQHISETKHLLEQLIQSSESFDYPKAKLALKDLQRKHRALAKAQSELLRQQANARPNVTFVPFRATT